jgi:hypothetical protein
MAGQYKQLVQYKRESAHKTWALGSHSSHGDYMFEIHHINEEENVLISWMKKYVSSRQSVGMGRTQGRGQQI